jgi:Glutathione S-transferase, C-terminal domain
VIKENNSAEGSTVSTTSSWPHVIGTKTTTADIALFHVLTGMEHAFPKRIAALRKDEGLSEVFQLVDGIRAEPPLEMYLKSKRRADFGQGIFRLDSLSSYASELGGLLRAGIDASMADIIPSWTAMNKTTG